MKPVRVMADGRRMVITSVVVEESLHALVKANHMKLSDFINTQLLSYFGLDSVEADLEKVRKSHDLIEKQQKLDQLRSENEEKRLKIAENEAKNTKIDRDLTVLSEEKRVLQQQKQRLDAEKARKSDQIVSDAHLAKLEKGWKKFASTHRNYAKTLKKRLPENDYQANHVDFWPAVVRELEKTTGEQFSEAEVVDYCRTLSRSEA